MVVFKRLPLAKAIRHAFPAAVGRRSTCLARLAAAGLLCLAAPAMAQFPAQLELAHLDGSNGFALNGIGEFHSSGWSVSGAGDVNGDGVDDLVIGAPNADANGFSSGQGYVIFGGPGVGVGGVIELASLDGSNGFTLNGVGEGDYAGWSVSGAGDINGDGIDDLIIGARRANPYVIFGGPDVGAHGVFELSDLNGANGFALRGINPAFAFGQSVSGAGDVNGDGIDDIVIGEPAADPIGYFRGQSYVVFGGRNVGAGGVVDMGSLDGSNGFLLNGPFYGDGSGGSVSGAGDINGDGIDDLVISASGKFGKSHVVFGGPAVGAGGVIELRDLGANSGFAFYGGRSANDSAQHVSRAGDINGDGIDDLVIGAPFARPSWAEPWEHVDAGQTNVVFGGPDVGTGGLLRHWDLDGTNGFVLNGIKARDRTGRSVSGAGDINGDGIDDLVIGAYWADPNGRKSGQSYVFFGGPGVGAGGVFELASLDGGNGFALNGISADDYSGTSVSGAGDINGDGIDDLVIGAPSADPNGRYSGQTYVVFGRPAAASTGVDIASLPDINGNLAPELASLRRFPDGRAEIRVSDSDTGALVRTLPVDTLASSATGEIKVPLGVIGVADLNGNGSPEVGVLLRKADGRGRVHIRDGASGQWLGKLRFFDPDWHVLAVTARDLDGDGYSEVSVLGVSKDRAVAAVHVVDSRKRVGVNWLALPATPGAAYVDVTGLDDVNDNGSHEIAVLRILADGTPQILVIDAGTSELIQTIGWARPKPAATGITGLPDVDGNGSPEVAMLQVNPNGSGRVIMRDAATGNWIGATGYFDGAWQARAISSQDYDVSVLARQDDGFQAAVQTRDALSGDEVGWTVLPTD